MENKKLPKGSLTDLVQGFGIGCKAVGYSLRAIPFGFTDEEENKFNLIGSKIPQTKRGLIGATLAPIVLCLTVIGGTIHSAIHESRFNKEMEKYGFAHTIFKDEIKYRNGFTAKGHKNADGNFYEIVVDTRYTGGIKISPNLIYKPRDKDFARLESDILGKTAPLEIKSEEQ